MKKYKIEEIKVIKEKLDKVICDTCEKEIVIGTAYYEVCTSHDGWGNDSVDSLEYFDFCKMSCLAEHMSNYFTGNKSYDHVRYNIDQIKFRPE